MSRIARTFEELRCRNAKAFIPFLTAGDPDMPTSLAIAIELVRGGADLLELGIPFSDPIADGPIIQESSSRALRNGTSVADALDLASMIRESSDVPIVLFSYFNPILKYGVDRFASEAGKAGVDGLLLTDLIDEEATALSEVLRANGIDLISLIAPTTTDERLAAIAERADGFLYVVARAGVTGVSERTGMETKYLVERARKFTDLPIAVGFGISTRSQIEDVWRYAEGAVVGSAIVREIERSILNGDAVEAVRRFVDQLLPKVAKEGVEI